MVLPRKFVGDRVVEGQRIATKARSFQGDKVKKESSHNIIPNTPIAEDGLFPESLGGRSCPCCLETFPHRAGERSGKG